jgi:hypothetical protein
VNKQLGEAQGQPNTFLADPIISLVVVLDSVIKNHFNENVL